MDIYTIQEEAYKRGYEAGVKSVTDNNVGGKMSPTDRERLIELITWVEDQLVKAYPYTTDTFRIEKTADHLIANGVTVQKEAKLYWKPVKPGEWNLTCSACDSHLGCKENSNFCPECGAKFVYPKAVAPWSPEGE